MPDGPYRVLTRHFLAVLFRSSGGTAARGLAGIAVPMLLASFWIVNLAHDVQPWEAAGIHYIFVLYAFCAMGCITTLQWNHLFPDRTDFLVLLPLPVRARVLFLSKLSATAVYLGLFLFVANIFGTLLLPALAPGHIRHAMVTHGAAVFAAGLAACLLVLAVEGCVIVVVPERWHRWIAPVVQTLLVAGMLTLFLRVLTVGDQLRAMLDGSVPVVRWFVPLWFTALYETHLGGITATPFARELARSAVWCMPALLSAVAITYPAAWLRCHRAALEGSRAERLRDSAVWSAMADRVFMHSPGQRAVFHFIAKTLSRQSRYHVLLATYMGAGLALALAAAVTISSSGTRLHLELSPVGVQAAMPLLLFWTVAGLHLAFSLPDDLASRWIFQVARLETSRVVSVTKCFVAIMCAVVLAAAAAMLLLVCHRPAADVLWLLAINVASAVILIDVFFFLQSGIPFTRPAMTERTNLPLTLGAFIFGLPVFVLLTLILEHWIGPSPMRLGSAIAAAVAVHGVAHYLRFLPAHPVSADAFLGESDAEVQTLGLSI